MTFGEYVDVVFAESIFGLLSFLTVYTALHMGGTLLKQENKLRINNGYLYKILSGLSYVLLAVFFGALYSIFSKNGFLSSCIICLIASYMGFLRAYIRSTN